ncbi:MAG: DUF5130 family protein [Geodermatophilaceae bacterium]|nr:DUF5130 family protein [Geodermatophilaceae bacterium]
MSSHASSQAGPAYAQLSRAEETVPTTRAGHPGSVNPPFSLKSLERLDEALTMASRETGIYFSLFVGRLSGDTRAMAERLHPGMGEKASNGVLVAVDPGQRVLEIVTGRRSVKRLPDRSCALAALSMTAAFGSGNLVGGIVNGLRMLSDQAGHPPRFR